MEKDKKLLAVLHKKTTLIRATLLSAVDDIQGIIDDLEQPSVTKRHTSKIKIIRSRSTDSASFKTSTSKETMRGTPPLLNTVDSSNSFSDSSDSEMIFPPAFDEDSRDT